MINASEPKTDRELLLNINDKVIMLSDDLKEMKENISGKTDSQFCNGLHETINTRLNIHSDHLNSLDRFRAWVYGGLGILAFVATILWLFFKNK